MTLRTPLLLCYELESCFHGIATIITSIARTLVWFESIQNYCDALQRFPI